MGDKASSQSRLPGTDALKKRYSSASYAVSTLKKMESLFLNEQFTDVVLIAGKRRIPAHRLLLSAASEYFTAMFTNDLKEASEKEIQLKNVNEDALLALINYCYTGNVEIETVTVEALLETACILQLTEVVEACCEFLKQQLHLSNCIGVWQFAHSLGCTDLAEYSQKYTCEHFVGVSKDEEFLKLSVDEVAKLLGSDDLTVSSEEDVVKGLLSWIEYDGQNRRGHVSELLKLIRFPLLPPGFIVDDVETKSIFRDSPVYCELLGEAFKYHLLPERRSMLQSSRTQPRKTLTKVLYVLGGSNKSVEKYDMNLNKWTVDNKFKVRTPSGCGLAEFLGKVYIVGGEVNSTLLDRVQCYNFKEKTFRSLPPMTSQRKDFGVAVLGGSLYAVGGYNPEVRSYSLNSVERFDLLKETWLSAAPMSSGRSEFGLAVLNGKLYVVGGSNGRTVTKTVECYDPNTKKWMRCARMCIRRENHAVGVLDGFLYAVGGCTTDEEEYGHADEYESDQSDESNESDESEEFDEADTVSTDSVERYDPKTNTWMKVASMNYARSNMGVCVLNGKLYAVGGDNWEGSLNSVEVYDPVKDEWEEVAPLTVSRANPLVMTIS